jgi:ABC-type glycerol-3-phosphate transport system substrate-binding protein
MLAKRNVNRRQFLALAGTTAAVVGLAACAPPAAAPSGDGAMDEPAMESASLQFVTNHGAVEIPFFQRVVDNFTEANPGVEIDLLNVATEYYTKINTQGVGGDLPDIFYTRTFDVVPYANLEWTINLQPLIDRDGIDTDDFWEAEVTQMIYQGDLYALPYDFSNLAVVYNAGIFEEVGLDVPSGDWDWNGLKEVGEALKEETDGRQTRWGFRAHAWPWVVLGIVHANGGRILSEDQTECVLHSDVNIETFQFFRDLMTDGVAPESGSMPQGVDPFSTGLLGMDSMGSWATQSQRERVGDSFTFDVVPTPYGSDGRRAVSAAGGAWGIAANSEYKEVTWEFNVHLTSTESTNILISEPVRSLPGRKSSVPAWNEAASREDLPPRNVEVFAQQMEDAYAEPFPVYWKDLQNIWFNRVAPLMQGGEDLDIGESLQKFQDEVNEIIAIS